MARVKRAVSAHKKRRTVLNRAKGYYGAKSRSYRAAKEQVQHSLQYMYRDRRNKKREIRRLWITRINAAARINGMSYSVLMNGLKKAGVQLDRKVLSDMAVNDPAAYTAITEVAKKACRPSAPARRCEHAALPQEGPALRGLLALLGKREVSGVTKAGVTKGRG